MNILTHEQEYRSEKLIKKIGNTHLIVCGCGAIGSNLIDNLNRQGFKLFDVIDMDRIEPHNIGSQIWNKRESGGLKVQRMKNRVFEISGASINAIPKKLTSENIKKFISNRGIVIDSFDNTESRQLLFDYCGSKNIDCLHIGLYKDYAEVIWNENYKVPSEPKGLDICEYPLARNIAVLSIVVASETLIKYIESGKKKNYMITLRDLKINELNNS